MKSKLRVLILAAIHCGIGASVTPLNASDEHLQTIQQNVSKWDKNGDGKLTGAERDEFIKAKRKEAADAENAARAAKLKDKPPRAVRILPSISPETAQNPIPTGVPKKIEEAQQ